MLKLFNLVNNKHTIRKELLSSYPHSKVIKFSLCWKLLEEKNNLICVLDNERKQYSKCVFMETSMHLNIFIPSIIFIKTC